MKKISLFIAALVIGYCSPVNAQSGNDDTEITVTNEKGEKETIELPGGMTCEFDSLKRIPYKNLSETGHHMQHARHKSGIRQRGL